MRAWRRTALGATLGVLLWGAPDLDAFCIIRDTGQRQVEPGLYVVRCCSGHPRRWLTADLPVDIYISDVTTVPNQEATRRAEETWAAIPESFFAFADAGLTDRVQALQDGFNIVAFDTAFCSHNPGSCGQGILAFSRCFSTGSGTPGYHATECDVIFNDEEFTFDPAPGPGQFSSEGVAAHELGHDAGISHCIHEPQSPGSAGCGPTFVQGTMYSFIQGRGTAEATLELDDIAAVVQIYPRWFLTGVITDAGGGQPLAGAGLEILGAAVPKDTIVVGEIPSPLPGDGAASASYVGGPFGVGSDGTYGVAALESTFTVITSAVGYISDTTVIDFPAADTVVHSPALVATATSSIAGHVRDAQTQAGIAATLTLFVNGAPFDSTSTAPDGAYLLSDVPVTHPPVTVYDRLEVRPALPYPRARTGEVTVIEGTPTVLDFDLGPAEVLLMDDDGGEGLEAYYAAALESLGVSYAAVDVAAGGSPSQALSFFGSPTVALWFTGGVSSGTVQPAEEDSLRSFLRRGGRLFLTGQNIAEDLQGRGSPFLSDALHVSWGGNINDVSLAGVRGDPVGDRLRNIVTFGPRGANNQTSRDLLISDGQATVSVVYDTVTQQAGGTWVEDAFHGSRAFLLGVGFEAINRTNLADTTQATRRQVMDAVLSWLQGTVASLFSVQAVPESSTVALGDTITQTITARNLSATNRRIQGSLHARLPNGRVLHVLGPLPSGGFNLRAGRQATGSVRIPVPPDLRLPLPFTFDLVTALLDFATGDTLAADANVVTLVAPAGALRAARRGHRSAVAVEDAPRGGSLEAWVSALEGEVEGWLAGEGDTDLVGGNRLLRTFSLGPNYPNPFNPHTAIQFSIPAAPSGGEMPVVLRIFSARGTLVRTILSGPISPGEHEVEWDGRDDQGASVGSGVYFYRLEAQGLSGTRKMLLLK